MPGKKPSQKAVQTIYVDSCFVDAYLWGDRDMKQHTNRVFIESKILNKDDLFDTTDSLIAAHAISDEFSTRLLTTDTNMQNSRVLIELEEKLRNEERKKEIQTTNNRRVLGDLLSPIP